MDLAAFRELLSPAGQEVLGEAEALEPREVDFLAHFTTLSRRFPAALARAALETAILRLEAGEKFPFSRKMYFTRPALEQATPHEVSFYRAGRYRSFGLAADLGCSIGGDSLALASTSRVAGLDLDPLRLEMAAANLAAVGLGEKASFAQADLRNPLPIRAGRDIALFFDPARRSGEKRIFSVRGYQPPLEVVREWLPRWPALGVKVSPGVKLEELETYEAEVEFISLKGELKEAALWFGPFKSAMRRATLLPGPNSLSHDAERMDKLPLSEPQEYLYEPDPAILRAGLVGPLGVLIGAAQLDPDIAYLTAPRYQPTPYARAWKVESWFPFGLKRLRAYLRERRVGEVVVKKRGSPITPEKLIHDLRPEGPEQRVVFLTQLKSRPIIVVCYSNANLL